MIDAATIEQRSRPTDEGDTYTYRHEGGVATLRVDLTHFDRPDEAADKLLTACDELSALLCDQGD